MLAKLQSEDLQDKEEQALGLCIFRLCMHEAVGGMRFASQTVVKACTAYSLQLVPKQLIEDERRSLRQLPIERGDFFAFATK